MAATFSTALSIAGSAAITIGQRFGQEVRLVRDEAGRFTFVVNQIKKDIPIEMNAALATAANHTIPYAASEPIRTRDSFTDPETFFANGWSAMRIQIGASNSDTDGDREAIVQVLDIPVWGRDWLWLGQPADATVPNVVFHGLKGGVGRSTAITALALRLARKGKSVLVVDLDLESPGVSGMLLDQASTPHYGIVDWLVEHAVHQSSIVVNDMVAESPLSRDLSGRILVAPAIGAVESEYLAKLGRVYKEIVLEDRKHRFSDRLAEMLRELQDAHDIDVVLIDSRAGLHEIAAIAITRLADLALLFCVDTAQTWSGYQQLFAHWRSRPDVLRHVRDRLMIVRAMASDASRERFDGFLEESFDLFRENLYDEVGSGEASSEVFSFDMKDQSAPHYPPIIHWESRFQELDFHLGEAQGGVSVTQLELAFGTFMDRVETALWQEAE